MTASLTGRDTRHRRTRRTAIEIEAGASVVQLIHEVMPTMSAAELRVGRALLSDFPRAALGTVSELAIQADVSTASVMRFCARLGFSGFAEFTSRVRDEVSAGGASPVGRARLRQPDAEIQHELEHRAELVRSLGRSIPAHELERLVEALADPSRTVITAGGSLSHLAAHYLQLQLRHIRPRVRHLADPQGDVGTVLDLRRRDLVVLFDFRRYEPRTALLASAARERGASVALFTDTWLSPVAKSAEIVLPLDVEASFLDSLTAAFALVEAIVPATAARLGVDALQRMDDVEALRQRLRPGD